MVSQNSVLQESLRQFVTASKEHNASHSKPCDGKIAQDFATWLEDVSRISCNDPENVALATSESHYTSMSENCTLLVKKWPVMKTLLQDI